MRPLFLVVLALGCSTPQYTNGALRCAPTGKACPDSFFCGTDHRCWSLGGGPDMTSAFAPDLASGGSHVFDLAQPPIDMSSATTIDMTPTPLVQIGQVTTGSSTFTATLPAPSRPGTLLVLTVVFDASGFSNGPSGWMRESGNSGAGSAADGEIWYLVGNPGGISSVTTTYAAAQHSVGQVSEWMRSGLDQAGWCWSDSAVLAQSCPRMPAPPPMTTHAGELGIACFAERLGSAGSVTLTPASGWVNLGNNSGAITTLHYSFDVALSLSSGASLSDTQTSSASGMWGGAVLSFY